MNRRSVYRLCLTAVFAAMILVVTALVQVRTPIGFIHLGDAFIYLAACFLPMPYAVAAASIGAAGADLLSGYAVWMPFTLLIKSLMALLFRAKGRLLSGRNIIACIVAGVINVAGYFLAGILLYGWGAALAEVPLTLIQSGAGAAAFLLMAAVLDRADIKHRMGRFL